MSLSGPRHQKSVHHKDMSASEVMVEATPALKRSPSRPLYACKIEDGSCQVDPEHGGQEDPEHGGQKGQELEGRRAVVEVSEGSRALEEELLEGRRAVEEELSEGRRAVEEELSEGWQAVEEELSEGWRAVEEELHDTKQRIVTNLPSALELKQKKVKMHFQYQTTNLLQNMGELEQYYREKISPTLWKIIILLITAERCLLYE